MQPQGHLQTLVRMLVHRQQPQAACDAPRWKVGTGLSVDFEKTMDPALLAGLKGSVMCSSPPPTATWTTAAASSSGACPTISRMAMSQPATRAATGRPSATEGSVRMATEREKMLAGELYDPLDAELVAARKRARSLCLALNATGEAELGERRRILRELLRRRWRFGLDAAAVLVRLRRQHRARRARVLQLQLHGARCVPGAHRRLHVVRAGRADPHAAAPARSGAAPLAGVRHSRSTSDRMCGWAAAR